MKRTNTRSKTAPSVSPEPELNFEDDVDCSPLQVGDVVTIVFSGIDEHPFRRGGRQITDVNIRLTIKKKRQERPVCILGFKEVRGEWDASFFKKV